MNSNQQPFNYRGFMLLSIGLILIVLAGFVAWFWSEIPSEIKFETGTLLGIAFVIGWGYALYIYYRPMPAGWTWLSVVIGETITSATATLLIHFALVFWDMLDIAWWLLLTPWLAEAVAGIPMIICQIWKLYRQEQDNSEIREKYRRGRHDS